MIDIHCHIIPEVDDGADSLGTSIMMCKIAYKEGINTIIATPHYKSCDNEQINNEKIMEYIKKINLEILSNNIPVNLLPGMEILISNNIIELFQEKKILTLNNSRYMLIELPNDFIPDYTERIFFNLMINGIIPILAHPERNAEIISKPDLISKFTEKGVLIQIDSGSLTGICGSKIQKVSRNFLKQNLVHFIATDAHSAYSRAPKIRDDYIYVNKFSSILAKKIFEENPFKVVNNIYI